MTGTARTIDVVVFDGCDELTVLGPWEVLRVAAASGVAVEVRLAHLPGAARVRGLLGLPLAVDGELDPDVDVLVVPGVGCPPPPVLAARPALTAALGAVRRRGGLIASVCTGGLLLGAAGLLDGRPATTHWDTLDLLRDHGADARDARVLDDGDVITSGGGTCGVDLGLHLVDRFAGVEAAYLTACRLEHEPRRVLITRREPVPTDHGHMVATGSPRTTICP